MIEQVLEQAIEEKHFPGASYAVGQMDGKVEVGAVGRFTYDEDSPKVTPDTLFDLASLTKVVATTSTAMVLHQHGELSLDRKVQSYDSRFQHTEPSIRHLLLHRSGLPAYKRFEKTCSTVEETEDALYALVLRDAIPRKTEYSCMGFMHLQRVMQKITGRGLDELAKDLVWDPLGMSNTQYVPDAKVSSACAPTELIPDWRRKIEDARGYKRVNETYVQGGVHDPAAFMMGGVSGNAGVFSTARDLGRWGMELLQGGDIVFKPEVLSRWKVRQSTESTRGLGFDTKAPKNSSAGRLFHANSFGHTGYTGTSVWIDPVNGLFGVLLTNRAHPDDKATIHAQRQAFYEAAYRSRK